jgi:hypothetical protein
LQPQRPCDSQANFRSPEPQPSTPRGGGIGAKTPQTLTVTPGRSRAESFRTGGVQTDKCKVCGKAAYALEKLVADEVTYHKACFKCEQCKKALSVGGYAALQGKIFCKPHFKQLFKLKGNYDEGFGKEQHKKKWLQSPGATVTESTEAADVSSSDPEDIAV